MTPREALTKTWAEAANGLSHDMILDAACNIILNSLRQQHLKKEEADEHLDTLIFNMREALRKHHYGRNGYKSNHIILPPIGSFN